MQGKLIVFEGTEGCGKTTQLHHLHRWLTTYPVYCTLHQSGFITGIITTREPGGTSLGTAIRQLLLATSQDYSIQDRAELLMYAADRAQHVDEMIRPALAEGYWVLCDRYIDSTVAYQGYGRGLDLALIDQLNAVATGGLQPDLTLWLRLDAEVGLARTHQRGAADRIEQTDLQFHRRVQQGFEALAKQYPQRIVPIAADRSPDAIHHDIQGLMEERLENWYGSGDKGL